VTGRRLQDLFKAGPALLAFGILMPLMNGFLGVYCGKLSGLSLGGSTIMGVLAASASYIAAPAAVRIALPQANPSIYLTASLAITFPFNVTVGLPIYYTWANYLFN
ncbi:MAG: sodium-dependent bicarbonate transport family permease, partial [Deltaproteobacteria bacterium]|nr:sodium-dependent bicarbonate transport family permease [Deltaproteobacteria bacterium]